MARAENNLSQFVLFLKGLRLTREVTRGNIPDGSELVARIVSSECTPGNSTALLFTHTVKVFFFSNPPTPSDIVHVNLYR